MFDIKYRILYFSSLFPTSIEPNRGAFSIQRVRALQRNGCEVIVISPLDMTLLCTKPDQLLNFIRRQVNQPSEIIFSGIPVFYPKWICPPKRIIGWYSCFFMFLQVKNAVKKVIEKFHPDVILSSWLPDAVTASLIGSSMKIPMLAIADGTDVNVWIKKYRAWNYAKDILNNKAAVIIFVSQALKTIGNNCNLYGRTNTVLHNAVDVNMFTPNASHRKVGVFKILGVSRLVPTKGLQVLLDAFANFKQRINQPTSLTLIGEGPQRDALMQQAVELGIGSSVQLVGPIEQKKLVKYYQEADVFCLPSFSEGFPCVILEAMACGKPVVASNVGGITEVVDDESGILVTPGDSSILCEALQAAKNRVWDGESIRKKIVMDFGWDKWVESMLNLICDSLQGSKNLPIN